MANPNHLELARQGKDAWNKWRAENPKEPADFSGTDFTLPENSCICFEGFEFSNYAHFESVTFGDLPRCWESPENPTGGAVFDHAIFGNSANFNKAKFGKWAHFEGTSFGNETSFKGTTFGDGTSFERAMFDGWAYFDGATFTGKTGFERARFDRPPNFNDAKGWEHLSLVGTRFRFWCGVFRWTKDSRVVSNLRRLRGVVQKIYATDAERDLFILERMAERGVLWKSWWYGGWKSRLFGWWRPLAATILMFFYWALSDCGRSVVLPIFWFIAANAGAFYVYSRLADMPVDEALWNLTFANMLPFGTLAKPLSEHAVVELFYGGVLPPACGLVAIGQGVVNALLVFLLALALRNHFKVK